MERVMEYLRQSTHYIKYLKIGENPEFTDEERERAIKIKLMGYLTLALLMSGVVLQSLSSFSENCVNKINCSWSVVSIFLLGIGAIISWGCFFAAWRERARLLLG